jgi:hypothetical protein
MTAGRDFGPVAAVKRDRLTGDPPSRGTVRWEFESLHLWAGPAAVGRACPTGRYTRLAARHGKG